MKRFFFFEDCVDCKNFVLLFNTFLAFFLLLLFSRMHYGEKCIIKYELNTNYENLVAIKRKILQTERQRRLDVTENDDEIEKFCGKFAFFG
jgi:hypothetical protein